MEKSILEKLNDLTIPTKPSEIGSAMLLMYGEFLKNSNMLCAMFDYYQVTNSQLKNGPRLMTAYFSALRDCGNPIVVKSMLVASLGAPPDINVFDMMAIETAVMCHFVRTLGIGHVIGEGFEGFEEAMQHAIDKDRQARNMSFLESERRVNRKSARAAKRARNRPRLQN